MVTLDHILSERDKTPPGPELPDEIVTNTLLRYEEARRRLFG